MLDRTYLREGQVGEVHPADEKIGGMGDTTAWNAKSIEFDPYARSRTLGDHIRQRADAVVGLHLFRRAHNQTAARKRVCERRLFAMTTQVGEGWMDVREEIFFGYLASVTEKTTHPPFAQLTCNRN